MARQESVVTLRDSGWSFSMVAHDDISGFTEEWLNVERKAAMGNMKRAQEFVVGQVKITLSRVYPLVRSGALRGRSSTDPAIIRFRRERGFRDVRQSSPPGAPPGRIMGDLQKSWVVGRRTWDKERTVLTGRYLSRHPGAGALEWGSPPKGIWPRGLPSRPYIRPTLLRIRDALGAMLVGADQSGERVA